MRLECHLLSKTYEGRRGEVLALEDVSFAAEGHEFVSLVGPSGCGKTTLLKCIAGLSDATAGRVSIDGAHDNGRPVSAFVFQDHGLFPWMTVLDNVAFGLRMRGVARGEREDRSMDLIERVGLEAFVDSFPNQLSAGMRQRVGIIRAFVTDPPLLLMDEPFGALDSQTRRVLQEELLKLWGEQRSIVLFVTHDIDEAVRLSDRVLVMSGRPGRILQDIHIPLDRPVLNPESRRVSRHDHGREAQRVPTPGRRHDIQLQGARSTRILPIAVASYREQLSGEREHTATQCVLRTQHGAERPFVVPLESATARAQAREPDRPGFGAGSIGDQCKPSRQAAQSEWPGPQRDGIGPRSGL